MNLHIFTYRQPIPPQLLDTSLTGAFFFYFLFSNKQMNMYVVLTFVGKKILWNGMGLNNKKNIFITQTQKI